MMWTREDERRLLVNASAADLWSVIAGTATWSSWNPLLRSARGPLARGVRLDLRLGGPWLGLVPIRADVTASAPRRRLSWRTRAWLPGLINSDWSIELRPVVDGRTRVILRLRSRGLLVPLAHRWLDRAQRALARMGELLATRLPASDSAAVRAPRPHAGLVAPMRHRPQPTRRAG